ncbi:SMI1/KNR4 family protein, partial [Bacillus anthracis]|uniref:SMI1/KNR4 family protein n=1 Tax=Bacillus anthracis TaxID=1392 RepID=UPI0028493897
MKGMNNAVDQATKGIQQMLNIKFPNSYHWFLKQYGSGGLDGMDIHGCETT